MAINLNPAVAPTSTSTVTIRVQAASGVRVPMEGAPRKYITDAEPVTVTRSAYYVRRLKERDLVLVDATAAAQGVMSTPTPTLPAQTRGVASEA